MLEPVLDLDEALDSELVREREMVVEVEQPELGSGSPARRPREALAHAGGADPAGARRLGEHSEAVLRERRLRSDDEIAALLESGASRAPAEGRAGRFMAARLMALSAPARSLLQVSELAERAGVPVATVHHYLREGLLPGPGQDLAQHGVLPAGVRRAHQADQAAPGGALHASEASSASCSTARRTTRSACKAMVEVEDRILAGAIEGERTRTGVAEVRDRYDMPKEVLDRLEKIGVLSPNSRGYGPVRRADHRGDQPLPRRRLRGGDRVHRLRHPALQARPRGPRRRGGRRRHGPPRGQARARRRDSSSCAPAPSRSRT